VFTKKAKELTLSDTYTVELHLSGLTGTVENPDNWIFL